MFLRRSIMSIDIIPYLYIYHNYGMSLTAELIVRKIDLQILEFVVFYRRQHAKEKEMILKMLGKTHLAAGIAVTLGITQPASLSELLLAIDLGAAGALISDIDVGTSYSRQEADKTLLAVGSLVGAMMLLDHFFHIGILSRILSHSGAARIFVGILLLSGICVMGREQPHRTFMHSFLALILLNTALGLIYERMIPYFTIGFLSHLGLDLLNRKGLRLFYPWKKKFALRLVSSGGFVNQLLFLLGWIASIGETAYFLARIFGIIS